MRPVTSRLVGARRSRSSASHNVIGNFGPERIQPEAESRPTLSNGTKNKVLICECNPKIATIKLPAALQTVNALAGHKNSFPHALGASLTNAKQRPQV